MSAGLGSAGTSKGLDGRRESDLAAELERRAGALLARGDTEHPLGPILNAILAVGARLEEEVTGRLDRVPEKQANNIYEAMGLGRDPARPARVPVAFSMADTAQGGLVARAGTKVLFPLPGKPVVFETETAITLANGTISSLAAVDLTNDAIYFEPPGIVDAVLPHVVPIPRVAASAAPVGAIHLQIDPAVGLAQGQELAIGRGSDALNYTVVGLENDLVTLEPPLERAVASGDPVRQLDSFAPFTASRDRQRHALYLGHASLLKVPSAVTVKVSDPGFPEAVTWSWWGTAGDGEEPAWHGFDTVVHVAGLLLLTKPAGEPATVAINSRESLWLRAELPMPSARSVSVQNLRLGLAGSAACQLAPDRVCSAGAPSIAFDAIAVTTPVVTNQPFHPFGREPRLFDAFYIGCAEAFSKPGAQVSMCFRLGGSDLGPLAAVGDFGSSEVFGVGSDGLLYRARIDGKGTQLAQVPLPTGEGAAVLAPRAPVSAVFLGSSVVLAVAGGGGTVGFASVPFGAELLPDAVSWESVPANGGEPLTELVLVQVGMGWAIEALAGRRLLRWNRAGAEWSQVDTGVDDVVALIRVQDTAGGLLVLREEQGSRRLYRRNAADAQPALGLLAFDATRLPERGLAARSAPSGAYYVAGFDGPANSGSEPLLRVLRTDAGQQSWETECAEAPIRFRQGTPPLIDLATRVPIRIAIEGEPDDPPAPLIVVRDETDFGTRTEPRAIVATQSQLIVQDADQGVIWRQREQLVSGTLSKVIDAPAISPANAFVRIGAPDSIFIGRPGDDGRWLLDPLAAAVQVDAGEDARFFLAPDASKGVTIAANRLTLANLVLAPPPVLGDEIAVVLQSAQGCGIWQLALVDEATLEWEPTEALTITPATYQLLTDAGEVSAPLTARDYFAPSTLLPVGLRIESGPPEPVRIERFGTILAFAVDPDLLVDGQAPMVAADARWQTLGPSRPSNPALSWEYWNGESWWALDPASLKDRTADLLVSDGVFFTVPPDLAETDVGGRRNHWIRARLIGGDYGEARTTVLTVPIDDRSTRQEVIRDTSAIRAPNVISLAIGYCVNQLALPEVVLTEDNRGFLDQTGANEAGLTFPVFTPVREAMTPGRVSLFSAPDYEESCDPPCTPSQSADPDPAPCDCCDEDGAATTASRGGATAFERALLIGLDRPASGAAITFYAAALPAGRSTRLAADMLIDGAWREVAIVVDDSHGLSEPGTIVLELPDAPQQVSLLGTPAHWLRLRPADGGADWSPRLAGLWLNAVVARSVETRENEVPGSSAGIPGQQLRLAEAPVEAASLELRVRELPGIEEREGLDVLEEFAGRPGPWVKWREVATLAGAGPLERVYTLDANSGAITFGDAREGAIPPLGGAVLAVRYRQVTGAAGNGVAAGAAPSLLSPIGGIEKVSALSVSAGGIDLEAAASARARAAAKVRHAGRIVSLADLKDFVAASFPGLVQLKAWRKGQTVRVAAVASGEDPVPPPARLRAIGEAAGEVSTYGIGLAGRLEVVPPCLLPIAVELGLTPSRPEDFADILEQARALLADLFDPARGGHDGRGWRLGAVPDGIDISAALEPIGTRAVLADIALARLDRDPPEPLPATLPLAALVRLAPTAVSAKLIEDASA